MGWGLLRTLEYEKRELVVGYVCAEKEVAIYGPMR
jgi:hypothetical protein